MATTNKTRPSSVKSANRVLDVLELLSRRARGIPHSEIAVALGIPKSSLTHLLRDLTSRGYLAFQAGPNTYELGPSFFALWRRGQVGSDIVTLARPVLEQLAAATSESCSFNRYCEDHIERVCGIDSPNALTFRMTPGSFPLYSTSSGKAILAALPQEERERYLARVRLEPKTGATIKTIAELRRQVAKVMKEGVGFSFSEQSVGVIGMAAAVRSEDGYPLGALNIAVPESRFGAQLKSHCLRELGLAKATLERELHAVSAAAK